MTDRIPDNCIEEWKRLVETAKHGHGALNVASAASILSGVAVPALLSERESLLSLLREVESSPFEKGRCPCCGGYWRIVLGDKNGEVIHAPDCRLAAFLKET